jgi:hypothetical protein
VAINNHRPHQEWYGNLFAMSPACELLIRKLWRQASSNFTVSHIDLNQMGRRKDYHPGSPSFAFYCWLYYGGRDVLPLLPVALAAVIAGEFCEIEFCLLRAVRPDQNTSGATGTSRSRSDLRDGTSNRLEGDAFI